jgi:tetratricopeptide (TPR) repeat protein
MNAQLIDARTDAHLWADSFDGDASDIFALQASLAQKIAAALKATLTPGERTLIERRPTQNQEAYDLYLRARVMQEEQGESGSLGDYEKILAVYQQAAAKDPTFALPHVQSAIVHLIVYWIANLDPSRERMTRAKAAVDAAVRLAPDAPETHLALGAYHYRVELDWNRALAEFRAAESSLPNQAQLCYWLAVTHRRLGNWSEALGYFERAAVLNPRELAVITNHSGFLTDLRRWGQARDTSVKYLRYFSSNRELLTEQARATFALDGDRAAWAHATEALPPDSFKASAVGDKYRATLARGDLGAADQVLAGAGLATLVEFERHVINDPVTFHRAYIAFVRGERDVAERLADQAIAFYRNTQWNVRQTPWVRMRIAQAEAWAGRADSAGRDAEAAFTAMTAQDAFDSVVLREYLGEVNIATGRREGALACLREMMIQPCALSPNDIRIHPLWSRLKDDPRFEEILKSAKAL